MNWVDDNVRGGIVEQSLSGQCHANIVRSAVFRTAQDLVKCVWLKIEANSPNYAER